MFKVIIMKVKVKLFANLSNLVPFGSQEKVITIRKGASVGDLLDKLKIPSDITNVVVVNGVQKDKTARLNEGDIVGIFPPIAGG
jgi:molybdopterin converting factor small subunit